jgi:CheY-like chemotaxis protein
MEKIFDGTILVVEDEHVFRMIYRGVLENAGFEVLEAENGKKGWDIVREKKPNLVLLDLILPEMSGYEVLEKIRKDPATKDIPVIVFSVMGAEENIQKALDLGANYFKIKGANSPSDILDQIDKILSK